MKKSSIYLIYFIILSFTHSLIGYAQSATIATDGVYVPRLTTTQRTAIATPTNGLMIYNTTDNCFNVYQNSIWQKLCGFEPSITGTWTQKTDFGGSTRSYAVAFSIGNKGYLGTGYQSSGAVYKKDFWEYDPANDSWTQKADFGGTGRFSAIGFSIGQKGYIGTGYDITLTSKKDFWEYDPIGNSWTQKTNFGGEVRNSAVGFSIGNKGYIGTGYDNTYIPINDFWEYNPANDTWVQKASLVEGHAQAFGFSIGGKGYVGTGFISALTTNDFWEFDPINNTWSQKTNFGGSARFGAVGFSIGSKGYVGTGQDANNAKNDFWEYSPANNAWIQKPNLVRTFSDAVCFSIGSKGYIGVGNNSNDFFEYYPNSPNLTQQGNTFNGITQLVQTDGNAKLPSSVLPTNLTTQGNVFNGANQLIKLDASGNLGLGTATPNAAIQFGNIVANRRIVLWEDTNNDHQYTGIGINAGAVRYQVKDASNYHVFYSGTNVPDSKQLMWVGGDGNVRIGAGLPLHNFEVYPETSTHGVTIYSAATHAHDWTFWTSNSSGTLFLYKGSSQRGTFNPTTGAYTSISDRKLKKNITDLESVITNVMKLKPSTYQYINGNPTNQSSSGLIAQDVEALFPNFVHKNTESQSGTTLYSIDYAGTSAIAIKAIQEQQKMIEELMEEIRVLKKK